MLVNPAANPDHDLPVSWTASAALGGQPTDVPLNLTFSQWAAWGFSAEELADASRTGPTADFDGDGLPNLIEYLTGTKGRQGETPSPIQWEIAPGPGNAKVLRMSFPRITALTGYALQVQSSDDFQTWLNDFTLVQSTPAANGTTVQQWEKPLDSLTPRQSMRLRATPVP